MSSPDNQGGKLLPFYLVVDVSYSMDGQKIKQVNQILPAIVDALARNPILSDKVRFGLIDFGDDGRVQLPLCDLLDPNLTLPGLAVRGTTSYVAAFETLRKEMASNIAQLKADGFQVHRPAAFFISDGQPNSEDWPRAFADLTGQPAYPNVIPFGVDDADPKILQQLIYPPTGPKAMKMFMQSDGANPAAAIAGFAEVLISSIIASGNSLAAGSSGTILPPNSNLPAGVSAHTADDDFV